MKKLGKQKFLWRTWACILERDLSRDVLELLIGPGGNVFMELGRRQSGGFKFPTQLVQESWAQTTLVVPFCLQILLFSAISPNKLKSWRELDALLARRQSIVRNRWGLALLFKRCSASRAVIITAITQRKLFLDANDGLDRVAQIKQKPLSEAIFSAKTAIFHLVRVGKLRTKNLKLSFFEPKFVVYREKQCFCLVPCSIFNFDKKCGISPTRLSKMAQNSLNIFEFSKKYQNCAISSPSRKMEIKRLQVPKTI